MQLLHSGNRGHHIASCNLQTLGTMVKSQYTNIVMAQVQQDLL